MILEETAQKTFFSEVIHIFFSDFHSGHMDFLERNYGKNIGIRLRMKDMVRVSPLEEECEERPESLQNYYDERY